MGNVVLLVVVALTVGAVVFGVITLMSGGDQGLRAVDADDRAQPLPADRPLIEDDLSVVSFDLAWRGYRMAQVDQTLRRLAYDIGYKSELIQVLEAEVAALREGRIADADMFGRTRVNALSPSEPQAADQPVLEDPDGSPISVPGREPRPVRHMSAAEPAQSTAVDPDAGQPQAAGPEAGNREPDGFEREGFEPGRFEPGRFEAADPEAADLETDSGAPVVGDRPHLATGGSPKEAVAGQQHLPSATGGR